MKKIIALLLVILTVLTFTSCNSTNPKEPNDKISPTADEAVLMKALEESPETAGSDFAISYIDGSNGVSITRYSGDDEIVVIPSHINNSPVEQIEQNCFANNKAVKAVKSGENVISIGRNAFGSCENLIMFKANEKLAIVDDAAFIRCKKLTSVSLNEELSYIGHDAFSNTESLKKLYIPASVEYIVDLFGKDFETKTIIGKKDSVAHEYALENNINFES